VATSDLKQLWQAGFGREDVVDNVEALVDRLIQREAELLISQNEHLAEQKQTFVQQLSEVDGLDEIEDLEDFNDGGQGFKFYGA